MNEDREVLSLCRVWKDSSNSLWLSRLADIRENELIPPDVDPNKPRQFYNRDRLYWRDGPREENSLGLWKWTAAPSDNDHNRDHIVTEFQKNISPTCVVIIPEIQTITGLITALKAGISEKHTYFCDTIFCYEQKRNQFVGVLCSLDEFKIQTQRIKLDEDIYVLPCYSFEYSDIYKSSEKDRNILFINTLRLSKPDKYVQIGDLDRAIQDTISDRMTKTLYKENIGKTIREWRECKELFRLACEPTLYTELTEKLNCPEDYVKRQVDSFIDRANHSFKNGDIDSDVLARIAMNHDSLRTRCEAVVEKSWREAHAAELKAAEEENHKCHEQLEQLKKEKKAAEGEKESILSETTAAKKRLEALQKEIEGYEALGAETAQAVREKIAEAQKDVSGFIAELSMFMPQTSVQSGGSCELTTANHWRFTTGAVYENVEQIEECEDWEDTLDLLRFNLRHAGVGGSWSLHLACFLYSAYLNRMPLLLAGPNAEAIANALSLTVCGKKPDILSCYGEQNSGAVSGYIASELAVVQNPFHPDWISSIPQNAGFTLWVHPFTEDLQIEPRSLYNYVYPVFTECFAEQLPCADKMLAGTKHQSVPGTEVEKLYRANMGTMEKFRLNRLMINRLNVVLALANQIGNTSDTSMEYLFGVLPMSVLSGRQDLLAEDLNEAQKLPEDIKKELKRFIEE